MAAVPRRYLEKLLESIVLALMGGLALVVVTGVVFRKAGAALVWYDEVASIMLAWLTYYGAALATLRHAHIGFPKLAASAPTRVRLGLVLVRESIVIGFFLLIAWSGWQVQQVIAGTFLVSMPSIPTGLAHSVIPIGALLFVLAELAIVRERLHGAPADTAGSPTAAPPIDEHAASRRGRGSPETARKPPEDEP